MLALARAWWRFIIEGFERSRSKSSPLEKTRSRLANLVELSWGFDRIASFDRDLLIGIFLTGFTLSGLYNMYIRFVSM